MTDWTNSDNSGNPDSENAESPPPLSPAERRAMREAQLANLWAGKGLAANAAPAEPPPPLAPLNRAAEILEALFNLERDLTAELLGILRQFDGPTLVAIFGSPVASPSVTTPAVEAGESVSGKEAEVPADAKASHGPPESPSNLPQPYAGPWDKRGHRVGPKPQSAFEYTRRLETPSRRSSHWSW